MSHHKRFKNESQDARRRDKHELVHPEDKADKKPTKPEEHHHKK